MTTVAGDMRQRMTNTGRQRSEGIALTIAATCVGLGLGTSGVVRHSGACGHWTAHSNCEVSVQPVRLVMHLASKAVCGSIAITAGLFTESSIVHGMPKFRASCSMHA